MSPLENLIQKLVSHLEVIYGKQDHTQLVEDLIGAMGIRDHFFEPATFANHWDQKDVVIITYGDTFLRPGKLPLEELRAFLKKRVGDLVSWVHVLPYFPWTSDDGFAVSDYCQVDQELGDWSSIEALSAEYSLMSDLVVNHCSASHEWFDQFQQGEEPGCHFFIEASESDDFTQVVRPRTFDLLRPTSTPSGIKNVWCTFGHDQVDLNYAEPKLLVELVKIIRQHLEHGVRIFRLDAVAFLWKERGTTCINLRQTHEIVRLFRTLIEHVRPDALMITETNIPNQENLSYFGNSNEAHGIYNFSLPPLLLHAFVTGKSSYLKQWMMGMPPAQPGTFYFNFIASHDGIGLRPAEGLLPEQEIETLVNAVKSRGGFVSERTLPGGKVKPYELNISLFDAFGDEESFICAHAILLALEGIPAFYIHSLIATRNDYQKYEQSGHKRHLNRHQWNSSELDLMLDDPESSHCRVFSRLKRLIRLRKEQPAFHPNATQFTLHLGDGIFAFWRQSIDRASHVFCFHNISNQEQEISLASVNLVVTEDWFDLISGVPLELDRPELVLRPYQFVWLVNQRKHLPY